MPPEDSVLRGSEDPAGSGEASIHDAPVDEEDLSTVGTDEPDHWAAAEGYTPLADMAASDGGGAMFMAFPSGRDSCDNDEGDPFFFSQAVASGASEGAFFADMTAFEVNATLRPCGDDDDPDEMNQEDAPPMSTTSAEDYRSLADQALKALEDEYSSTLQSQIPPFAEIPSMEETCQPITHERQRAPHEVLVDQESFLKELPVPSIPKPFELPEKDHPPIDTEAVRRAVDAIRLKAPKLTTSLQSWQQEHNTLTSTESSSIAPREHPIIPPAPLSAFRKRSPKALQATANLSRSATLAEALLRLTCQSPFQERVVIHVVGADHVECDSTERLRFTFGPLVRWVGALDSCPREMEIHLIGPNVPTHSASSPPVNLMPTCNQTTKLKSSSTLLASATAQCHASLYHDWIQPHDSHSASRHWPTLVVAFNAGIWGYDEWRPTLSTLSQLSSPVSFVVTAYTIQEAEDDADVIEDVIQSTMAGNDNVIKERCLWGAELNMFGSKQKRETFTAVAGRDYRENSAWQAWKLGGIESL